jgi:hypothetical protein
MAKSLSDIAVRDEVKEVLADARPQAMDTRKRIRWNRDPLLRDCNGCPGCFEAENEADVGTSFAAVERSMSDRLLNAEVASIDLWEQQGPDVFRKGRERNDIHVHIADANVAGQIADMECDQIPVPVLVT